MSTQVNGDNTNVWQVMGETFELSTRYKVTDYLGAGAYGVVCAAYDSLTNTNVAIKKCKKIFHSRTLAKRTLREIRLLRLFNHDNIIKIKTILKPYDLSTFDSLYLVFDQMETDLAQIIRSPQRLRDQHFQYFTYQLLLSLKYLHDANIVHRDLKPRNLLVNGDCLLKLADFGLARLYNKTNDTKIIAMTEYVTTRWYRAPEILVGWTTYSSAIDMWAVGCILGELMNRTPLFPGADSMKQLMLICQLLGKPNSLFIENSRKQNYKQYLRDLDPIPAVDLVEMFPDANPLAIDLMTRLLRFTPEERLTADEALSHPYLKSMPKCFPKEDIPLQYSTVEFDFENRKLSWENLRIEIIREVAIHNPDTVNNESANLISYPSASELRIAAGKSYNAAQSEANELKYNESVDNALLSSTNIDYKDSSNMTIDKLSHVNKTKSIDINEKNMEDENIPNKFIKDDNDNPKLLDSRAMSKTSNSFRPTDIISTRLARKNSGYSKEIDENNDEVDSKPITKRAIRKTNVYDCTNPEESKSAVNNCIIM